MQGTDMKTMKYGFLPRRVVSCRAPSESVS